MALISELASPASTSEQVAACPPPVPVTPIRVPNKRKANDMAYNVLVDKEAERVSIEKEKITLECKLIAKASRIADLIEIDVLQRTRVNILKEEKLKLEIQMLKSKSLHNDV